MFVNFRRGFQNSHGMNQGSISLESIWNDLKGGLDQVLVLLVYLEANTF